MSKPLLIAFEGGDGSGKSTQATIAAERIGALLTRQAGGSPLGERVREILLDDASADLSIRAELLLYMADRAEHVQNVVRPALENGRHVVSDRWAYSSIVYQGYGRGLDIAEIRHLSDWAMEGLWPDVVILLDVPVEAGAERISDRAEMDHYELAGATLQERVIAGYHELAAADPERWQIVDGTGSVAEVAARVWDALDPHIGTLDQ